MILLLLLGQGLLPRLPLGLRLWLELRLRLRLRRLGELPLTEGLGLLLSPQLLVLLLAQSQRLLLRLPLGLRLELRLRLRRLGELPLAEGLGLLLSPQLLLLLLSLQGQRLLLRLPLLGLLLAKLLLLAQLLLLGGLLLLLGLPLLARLPLLLLLLLLLLLRGLSSSALVRAPLLDALHHRGIGHALALRRDLLALRPSGLSGTYEQEDRGQAAADDGFHGSARRTRSIDLGAGRLSVPTATRKVRLTRLERALGTMAILVRSYGQDRPMRRPRPNS